MCKKERRSDAGEADAAITEDRSSNRRNNGFSLEFRKEAKSAVWNLRPPSSRDDLEEAPRINPGLLFLTPPHLTKVGGPQPANRSVPFGTFDFHACWLRTNSERQQKWLALKLSFPRPPSRVLPRAFIGAPFSPAQAAQSASRSFLSRLGLGSTRLRYLLGLLPRRLLQHSASPPASAGSSRNVCQLYSAAIWRVASERNGWACEPTRSCFATRRTDCSLGPWRP